MPSPLGGNPSADEAEAMEIDEALVGPLQKAPGGFTHLLVAIDKFSKWIEA